MNVGSITVVYSKYSREWCHVLFRKVASDESRDLALRDLLTKHTDAAEADDAATEWQEPFEAIVAMLLEHSVPDSHVSLALTKLMS